MASEPLQELFKIGPFEGLDMTTDPSRVNPEFAVDMTNVVPYRVYGQFVAAKGRTSGATTGVFSSLIKTFIPFETSTGLGFLSFTSAGVLQFALVGGAPVNVTLPAGVTLTAGAKMRYVVYAGNMFLTNSVDLPLRILQTTPTVAQRWGIPPPLTVPVASVGTPPLGSETNVYGSWYYCYTYSNGDIGQPGVSESSHSPISPLFVLTWDGIHNHYPIVSVTASTDPQVTTINLYEISDSSTIWTFVSASTNVTGPISQTLPYPTGSTLILHKDPPAVFRATCMHKERLWGFGYDVTYPYSYNQNNTYTTIPPAQSDLWFSRYADPTSFNCVDNVLPIGKNNYGDTAVALQSTGSILVALKSRSFSMVYGDSEQDFRPVPGGDIGCYSAEASCSGYGFAFWLSPDGNIWQFDGQSSPINISEGIENRGAIKSVLDNANGNFLSWQFAVFNRVLYVNTGTVTYCYYLKNQQWHKLSYGTVWLAAIPQYPYLAGVSPSGVAIDRWGNTDGDSYLNPYTSTWQTGVFDLNKIASRKMIRFVSIKIPPGDPANTLKVTFIIDGTSVPIAQVLNPRALTSGNQGIGGWYYRLSLPQNGMQGYSISMIITGTTATNIPIRVSEIRVLGTFTDDLQAQNVSILGGGT